MAHTHDAARAGRIIMTVVMAVAAFALVPFAAPAVPAASAADATGTLTVEARWGGGTGTALAGDTFSVARVASADLDESGAISAFHTLDAFIAHDADWRALSSSELNAAARRLDEHASRQGLYAMSGVTDGQGRVVFTGLETGLYLVARSGVDEANARYSCDPFLVAIPEMLDGAPTLQVTVEPKFSGGGTPTDPETPNPGGTPDNGNPGTPGTPGTGGGDTATPGDGDGASQGGTSNDAPQDGPDRTAATGAAVTGVALLAIALGAVAIVLRFAASGASD